MFRTKYNSSIKFRSVSIWRKAGVLKLESFPTSPCCLVTEWDRNLELSGPNLMCFLYSNSVSQFLRSIAYLYASGNTTRKKKYWQGKLKAWSSVYRLMGPSPGCANTMVSNNGGQLCDSVWEEWCRSYFLCLLSHPLPFLLPLPFLPFLAFVLTGK